MCKIKIKLTTLGFSVDVKLSYRIVLYLIMYVGNCGNFLTLTEDDGGRLFAFISEFL